MPVGNIDPQNDTYTRASMKLGNEEYPNSIQQALCKNTGYLMYQPRSLSSGFMRYADITGGATLDMRTSTYMTAGKYNLYASMVTTSATGTVYLDGTAIISADGNGSLGAWSASADGWYSVGAVIDMDGDGSTSSMGWNITVRQYEE